MDSYTIISSSSIVVLCSLMCIESRLKEELGTEWCADFDADDGDGKTVTIPTLLVARAYLSRPRFGTAVQPRSSPNRTSWEFGRYMKVEIPKCNYVSMMNGGTEEDLMKVKESYRFMDDETEMAGVVTEPKVSGSLRRVRVCEEEYDVCSSSSTNFEC